MGDSFTLPSGLQIFYVERTNNDRVGRIRIDNDQCSADSDCSRPDDVPDCVIPRCSGGVCNFDDDSEVSEQSVFWIGFYSKFFFLIFCSFLSACFLWFSNSPLMIILKKLPSGGSTNVLARLKKLFSSIKKYKYPHFFFFFFLGNCVS